MGILNERFGRLTGRICLFDTKTEHHIIPDEYRLGGFTLGEECVGKRIAKNGK